MKPSIGRIVIYRQGDHERAAGVGSHASHLPDSEYHPGTNGTREHPAVITRVWSDHCVNLHVLHDAHPSEPRCSVTQLPELPEGTSNISGNSGWRWPDRV